MDDVAKAAEAVSRWLEGLCNRCADVENCEFCRLDSLKYETRPLEDLARAVLDAAGVEVLRTTADEDSLHGLRWVSNVSPQRGHARGRSPNREVR